MVILITINFINYIFYAQSVSFRILVFSIIHTSYFHRLIVFLFSTILEDPSTISQQDLYIRIVRVVVASLRCHRQALELHHCL